jgi:hypothetical protein
MHAPFARNDTIRPECCLIAMRLYHLLHIHEGQCGLCTHFGEEHPHDHRLTHIRTSIEAQRARLRATNQERNPLFLRVACLTSCPFCAGSSKAQRARLRATRQGRNSLFLRVARLIPGSFCACPLRASEDFVDNCGHPLHERLHLKVTATSGCDGFESLTIQ